MTAADVLDAVDADTATERSRLGSAKSLYAATGGELEGERVLEAAATAERAAAETFEAWAEDEADDRARACFAATAAEEREHVETVLAELAGDDAADASDEVPALPAHLQTIDDTVERAGALLGRVLVADASKAQFVGYFVGDADPQTASVFRDLRSDLDDQRERVMELIDAVCETDEAYDRARAAAVEAIEVAYDEHVATLESLGVDPKPVC